MPDSVPLVTATKRRIAVILPGIMGSSLSYKDSNALPKQIWTNDMVQNYKNLLFNPGLLAWVDIPAKGSLITEMQCTLFTGFRLVRVRLWTNMIRMLRNHSDFSSSNTIFEYGYDWRASLLYSASDLVSYLQPTVPEPLSLPPNNASQRFTIISHSMGGLLIRIALGLKILHPGWIDRIVHIGSPLKGAVAAFRAAYGSNAVPFLSELVSLFYFRNSALFSKHLLSCLRTFPSVYQLLPTRDVRFLYYSPSVRTNPLDESYIPATFRDYAEQAHDSLARADEIVRTSQVPVYSVYTAYHSTRSTEVEYRVTALARNRGYIIDEVIGRTAYGDGTVVVESACGYPSCKAKPVHNISHAQMPNSPNIISIVATLL